jgi:hypothetical protein
MTMLDQFTLTTVPLEQYFGETRLGQGTGFMWLIRDQYYLVTNWHVLSARDFFTGGNLRKDAGRPNILRTLFNIQTGSFDKQRWDITIRDEDDRPLWLVHPSRRVDIAVVPIPFRPKELVIALYPLNVLANARLRMEVGMEVFILGYPFEIKPPAYPVWKRGSIASEPQLDQSYGGSGRRCLGGHAAEQIHRSVFRPCADRPSARSTDRPRLGCLSD